MSITFRQFLGLIYSIFVLVFDIVIVRFGFPQENKDIVLLLLGGLNTHLGSIVGYYFGSSHKGTTAPDTTTVEVTSTQTEKPYNPMTTDPPTS